ncbi:hypothetical protein ACLKA6_018874 [Drosophila palustris]
MDFKAKKRALAATNVTIAALLAAYYLLKEQEEEEAQERKRSHWVNPYLLERRTKGRYETSFENMVESPKVFLENFHMSEANFNYLFSLVKPYLQPKRNYRPDAIPPKAKFCVVLEMLASGTVQRHAASTYRITLSGQFPKWDKENMLKWSEEFEKQWNFPNCIGAIDT